MSSLRKITQIKRYLLVIFPHLKLWVVVAKQSLMWTDLIQADTGLIGLQNPVSVFKSTGLHSFRTKTFFFFCLEPCHHFRNNERVQLAVTPYYYVNSGSVRGAH